MNNGYDQRKSTPDQHTLNMPAVSVIIPCYNGEAYLGEAIDSALVQTYPNVQVIVVDDGSTDRSAEVMAKYGNRIMVVRQRNAGLSAARNAGIASASGSLLAFLDADDWWNPSFLEKMVTALDSSGATIAYCGWQNIGIPGKHGEPFIPPDYEKSPEKLRQIISGTRWPVHAAVVRQAAVQEAGGFDTELRSAEDFALWVRIATRHPIILVPEVLAFYRHHGDQMTRNRDVIALNHWRAVRTFLEYNKDIAGKFGPREIRELTEGDLLRRGYECYWKRDLHAARSIFRQVMKTGYGSPKDWKYMLPALLPLSLHESLIHLLNKHHTDGSHVDEKDH